MKKMLMFFLVMTCMLANLVFADSALVQRDGNAYRVPNVALGDTIAKELSGSAVTGSITITTESFDSDTNLVCFIEADTYGDAAVSTFSSITGGVEGDIVYLQTTVASQDIVVDEAVEFKLGATSRTLSDPQDMIVLLNYDGTNWKEIGYFNNN